MTLIPRLALSLCGAGLLLTAAGGQPVIYYSDLESGPKTGGENNAGVFVTIYGKGFGATQGTSYVTIGDGRAGAYPVWTDSKIAMQLGKNAETGGIVVTTDAGASKPLPFTVRAGRIFFVAKDGKDGNSGSFGSPWKTLTKARDSIKAGDTVYARDGVAASVDDGYGWSSCLTLGGNAGTPGNPKAFVVYPGESATIGNELSNEQGGCGSGIRTKGQGESYWTIAGFAIRGGSLAISTATVTNWRLIANDMSCPNGNAQAGCLTTGYNSTFLYIYGNVIHDVATNLKPENVTALYHGVYFADGSNHVWFGWNTVANVQGCRGIQQNVSDGGNSFDLHIHDNIIHDTQCDGIVITTVDPSQGPVELYNNIIYNVGKGPNNKEHSGAWSCINLQGYDKGTPGSGTIDVYNNTLYNCGIFPNPPYGGSTAGLLWVSGGSSKKNVKFHHNIVSVPNGIPYVRIYDAKGSECTDSSGCNAIQGSNNLFYGNGAVPSIHSITESIGKNPMFVNPAQKDFHLAAGTPAKGLGALP